MQVLSDVGVAHAVWAIIFTLYPWFSSGLHLFNQGRDQTLTNDANSSSLNNRILEIRSVQLPPNVEDCTASKVLSDTIIKTKESQAVGAVFISSPTISSREECVAECCASDQCSTAVIKEKVCASFISLCICLELALLPLHRKNYPESHIWNAILPDICTI